MAAGCGGTSPSGPSTVTPPSLSPAVTQTIVGALTQAASMLISTTPDGLSRVVTYSCPAGGSMTMTIDLATPPAPSGGVTTSTRTEFNDCRSQTVTINGDPYLTMTGEHAFVRDADGRMTSMTATIRQAGGVRFDAGATQGRARYDCTQVMSMQIVNGTPSVLSMTSAGTITWEQPLGTVTVRPCGP
jgi:hypothetical protein